MAQSIISSAMNDPASTLNATATQMTMGAPQAATPTGVMNTAPQPAAAGTGTTTATGTATATGTPTGTTGAGSTAAPGTYTLPGLGNSQFTNYNGQSVLTGDSYKQTLQEQADQHNKLFGTNWSAMDYDKSANPDSWGARWGMPQGTPTPGAPSTAYTAAQLGDPTKWNVTGEQTVAGQLKTLLDANSPIIQQARAMGLAGANDRGLLNSSIGESAGLDAAYRAAVPIATSDAGTYARAAGYNADESNQFAVHNVDAQNDASRANLSAQTQLSIANLQAQTQTNLAYLDASTKTNLANLSNDNQVKLATIEAQYHTIMQSSASASDLFRQVTQNIATISASKDMDAAAKQQAVDNQLLMLKNGMQVNGAISNLDLGSLLNFSDAPPIPDDSSGAQQGGGNHFQASSGALINDVVRQAGGG